MAQKNRHRLVATLIVTVAIIVICLRIRDDSSSSSYEVSHLDSSWAVPLVPNSQSEKHVSNEHLNAKTITSELSANLLTEETETTAEFKYNKDELHDIDNELKDNKNPSKDIQEDSMDTEDISKVIQKDSMNNEDISKVIQKDSMNKEDISKVIQKDSMDNEDISKVIQEDSMDAEDISKDTKEDFIDDAIIPKDIENDLKDADYSSKDNQEDITDTNNNSKDTQHDIEDFNDDWPSMYNGPGVCKIDQYGKRVTFKNRFCRRLPDAAIVGFEKCGTMTLLTFLGVHPDIIETSSTPNLDFFSTSSNMTYCTLSKKTACTPRGVIKVSKLAVLGMNPSKIYKFKKDIRLIFVVRDPVERALSHFVHLHAGTSMDNPVKDFTKLVNSLLQDKTNTTYMRTSVLGFSFYILKLKEWLKYFPMKNIHIVDGDKFSNNPVEELQKIEIFLKLRRYIRQTDFIYDESKRFYCMKKEGEAECMPARKGRPHPRMMQHTKDMLKALFLPYNREFYKLVGRTFTWDKH